MPRIRHLLLLGHTHHDVGYTNSPRIIDRMHERLVSEVLDLCDRDDGHQGATSAPGDAAVFRWTFEVARPVINFVTHSAPEDVERLRRRVAEGRISVTGGYLNMTQLPSESEFDGSYDALRVLSDAGISVSTEQHGDVNGIAWGAVPGMQRAGIRRLVMALNPDHGRAPFPQPTGFWWQGQDGSRLFTWLSTHYGYGEEWGIVDGDVTAAERNIAAFVEQLEARDDYPYDTALVHAGNDNRWPTAAFLDVVDHWNARHPDVRMRTTTIDAALDLLQEQAEAADIPVVSGEWSDWWSHGHGSTAREVAVYREARSFARAAQSGFALTALRGDGDPALATVLGYRRGPARLRSDAEVVADLARVDEQLLLFGEHTWGSWETYSKPHSTFSHSHWNAKAGFAYNAFDHARDLAIEGIFRLVASGNASDGSGSDGSDTGDRDDDRRDGVLVANLSERERTEPVSVEIDGARRARMLVTAPAFGTAFAEVPPPPVSAGPGREISTERYRVTVDPLRGGVVSIIDSSSGRELVDRQRTHGLGAVVTEAVEPGSEHPMVTRNPKDFHPDHLGPVFEHHIAVDRAEPAIEQTDAGVQISWTGHYPESGHGHGGVNTGIAVHSTLVLYHDSDLIDLDVHIDKPEVFGPESIFVAFPFAATDPEFLLETAGAVYAAGTEQIQDTSKDWYSIQHAAAVNSADGGILWGSFDAPLVQVGGFHTGKWARELEVSGGQINSWVANNLHFTNFQARQQISRTFRYRFAPQRAGVTRQQVRRFGRDLAEPLQARQYNGPVRLDGSSGLSIDQQGDVIAELRPLGDGGVRVRLRNVGPSHQTVRVRWNDGAISDEVPIESEGGGDVVIEGYTTRDLIVRRTHG
ncbi:hypothetical protein GCM10027416_00630 [Okibacterium endophyticum]